MARLKKRLPAAAVFAAALAAAALPARAAPPASLGKAEDFFLLDQAGRARSLHRLSDAKAVVLIGQSDGCPPLRGALPALKALRARLEGRGVEWLMINAAPQDSREAIAREAAQFGFDLPILRDETQAVARSLGLTRAGEAVVVDPRGWNVVFRGGVETLPEALDALLSGRRVEPGGSATEGCVIAFSEPGPLTYTRDAAPLLRQACLSCHYQAGAAPALTSFESVHGWAPMIRETLLTGRMPPWDADPAYGPFLEQPALDARGLKALVDWVEAGAPRGDGPDPLADYRPPEASRPDVAFRMARPQSIPASGPESFRVVPLEPPAPTDLWVTGSQATGSNLAVLHHVQLLALPPDFPAYADEDPRWAQELRKVTMNAGRFQISAGPLDARSPAALAGAAVFVPKGTRLALNVHYVPSGKPEVDDTRVGVFLFKGKGPPKPLRRLVIMNRHFDIPAGAEDFRVTAETVLKDDALVVGFWPHMHNRGSWMRLVAVESDGRARTLASVPRFAPLRQRLFEFARPPLLRAGTRLVVEGGFDNSRRNPLAPDPSSAAHSGSRSSDEMFQGHVYWISP